MENTAGYSNVLDMNTLRELEAVRCIQEDASYDNVTFSRLRSMGVFDSDEDASKSLAYLSVVNTPQDTSSGGNNGEDVHSNHTLPSACSHSILENNNPWSERPHASHSGYDDVKNTACRYRGMRGLITESPSDEIRNVDSTAPNAVHQIGADFRSYAAQSNPISSVPDYPVGHSLRLSPTQPDVYINSGYEHSSSGSCVGDSASQTTLTQYIASQGGYSPNSSRTKYTGGNSPLSSVSAVSNRYNQSQQSPSSSNPANFTPRSVSSTSTVVDETVSGAELPSAPYQAIQMMLLKAKDVHNRLLLEFKNESDPHKKVMEVLKTALLTMDCNGANCIPSYIGDNIFHGVGGPHCSAPTMLAHPDEFKNPSSFLKIYGDPLCGSNLNSGGMNPIKNQNGNWVCQKCENINFPRRFRCNKCSEPRDYRGDDIVYEYARMVYHQHLRSYKVLAVKQGFDMSSKRANHDGGRNNEGNVHKSPFSHFNKSLQQCNQQHFRKNFNPNHRMKGNNMQQMGNKMYNARNQQRTKPMHSLIQIQNSQPLTTLGPTGVYQ